MLPVEQEQSANALFAMITLSAKKRDRIETISATKANGPSTISNENNCENIPMMEQDYPNSNENAGNSVCNSSLRQRRKEAMDHMEFAHGVVTNFPQLDIVCFQETMGQGFC